MAENNKNDKNGMEQPFSAKIKKYLKNLIDFSHFDTKTIVYIVIFAFLIVISLLLLIYVYVFDRTFLYRLVVEWFVNPVYALGFWGAVLFIIIMALQGLIVPLPSEIVLLATGMIWGLVLGGFMGVMGSMCAALLCFYLSRRGGRPLVKKFIGEKAIGLADNFIKKYGTGAILLARFLPFIAFDPISYVSGLVEMDIKKYSLGTLIGSIPRAFFFSWLGASLGIIPPINFATLPIDTINAQSELFNNVLLIILAVLVVMFIAYYIIVKYYEKKKSGENSN